MTRTTLGGLIEFVKETPALRSRAEIRHELAERYMEFEIGRWLCYRVAEMQSKGKVPNSEASVSKVFGTELQRQMGVTGMRVLGMAGQVEPPDVGRDTAGQCGPAQQCARFGQALAVDERLQRGRRLWQTRHRLAPASAAVPT